MHDNTNPIIRSKQWTGEVNLPSDFAQRVMTIARKKLRRRRLQYHIGAATTALLLAAAIPVVTLRVSRRDTFSFRESAIVANPKWQATDDALAYELAKSTVPSYTTDYLLPNSTALIEFTSAYMDSPSQQYANWPYDR